MTKFYVIAGATRFVIQEVEAPTKMEAERKAYKTDPSLWDKHIQSDNYEQYETLELGEESQYINLEEGV